MKYMTAPTEFKALGESGTFSGYASVFGNIDLGGDIVERGAFKEFVTNSEGKVVVLWQHDARSPVGVADFRQDDKGLAFDGQLVMEDARARSALAHMKAKSVEGMSFGYDVLPGGAEMMESGVRSLKALKVWELSIVTWGMNPLAGVTSAKMRQVSSLRDYEDFLRDVGGFSAGQAKLLASGGWSKLQCARDERGDGDDDAADRVVFNDFLKSIRER